jgi:large subunit ribosomal protein L21
LGDKIVVFKFKPKAKYRRRTGHRQHLTRIRIDAITADGKTVRAEERKPQKAAKAEEKESRPARARTRKPKTQAAADARPELEEAGTKPTRRTRATKAAADAGKTESKTQIRRARKPKDAAASEE